MQPDLKAKLEAAATAAGRSLNAEIVARLERTLTEDEVGNVANSPHFMAQFISRIEEIVEKHGIEYVFPEVDSKGRQRRVKPPKAE
ncbi:Arc family DNA-binding protein [Massilia pseudoviolaceinigra]|uniref:Arc family DNA-binding protein n=1 Tax=Massilia pseudoviolaceinigra TaxID=3057165 RepID=UPI0027966723|nr:Arc family DNA-binding protein [Massilia sp. CCM 9206]MDQ1924572.1 TraY domain-containing protein [Massilia sp. CCM 9206]